MSKKIKLKKWKKSYERKFLNFLVTYRVSKKDETILTTGFILSISLQFMINFKLLSCIAK